MISTALRLRSSERSGSTRQPTGPTRVATVARNLGAVLRDRGDRAAAAAALERALWIDEAAYGPDHPEVATIVNNLGIVLRDRGDLAGAAAALERALAIYEAFYGSDHPSTATARTNLESLRAHVSTSLTPDNRTEP